MSEPSAGARAPNPPRQQSPPPQQQQSQSQPLPPQHQISLQQQQQQQQQQQRTAEARNAFVGTLHSVGSHADTAFQTRAQDIQANAAVLARQESGVQRETAALARQTAALSKVADDAAGKLKELGDVQNWAEMLQRDLLVLEETVRIVDEEGKEVAKNGPREGGGNDDDDDDDGDGGGGNRSEERQADADQARSKWRFW